MNEFFFALFILVGFLIGTVLFGHLFFLAFYSLPNQIKINPQGSAASRILSIFKTFIPSCIWITVSAIVTVLISEFFSSYLKLFYCGLIISLVFIVGEALKSKN